MGVVFIKKLVLKLIKYYQTNISPYRPKSCRFLPTCSQYAKEAFETYNFFYAALLSLWRILRCNPFTKGGVDPVPEQKKYRYKYPPLKLEKKDK